MTAKELETLVAGCCQPRQPPLQLPTDDDWSALESAFECKFPPLFYDLHRLYSHYYFVGEWLPVASHINPHSDTVLLVAHHERKYGRYWSKSLVPMYALGNGDYVCLSADEGAASRVWFADHERDEVYVLKDNIAEFLADPDWSPGWNTNG